MGGCADVLTALAHDRPMHDDAKLHFAIDDIATQYRRHQCKRLSGNRHLQSLLLLLLTLMLIETAPTPAGCDSWAASGECSKNPGFMWDQCAAACKSHGFKDPFDAVDE